MNIQNRWNIYTHSTIDNNWNNKSYNKIFSIDNIFDLRIFEDSISKLFFDKNMIFIMRDNIFPTWEDKSNKNGCTASFKINNKNIIPIFINILNSLIGENIHKNIENYNYINGLSIIPKKSFYILKIWFKPIIDNVENYIKIMKPYLINNNCRIKKNII